MSASEWNPFFSIHRMKQFDKMQELDKKEMNPDGRKCKCTNNGLCLTIFCECFAAGDSCGESCLCQDCENSYAKGTVPGEIEPETNHFLPPFEERRAKESNFTPLSPLPSSVAPPLSSSNASQFEATTQVKKNAPILNTLASYMKDPLMSVLMMNTMHGVSSSSQSSVEIPNFPSSSTTLPFSSSNTSHVPPTMQLNSSERPNSTSLLDQNRQVLPDLQDQAPQEPSGLNLQEEEEEGEDDDRDLFDFLLD